MSVHLSDEQMKKYSEKKLELSELLRLDEHLSVCEDCRAMLTVDSDAVVNSFQQEFTGQPQEQHLTYDQLVGYLEKKPETDRELVETHMEICSGCKREYEDLRDFSMEVGAAPVIYRRAIYPVLAVAAVLAVIALIATLRYREPGPQQTQQPTGPEALVVSINDAGTRLTLDQNGKLSGLKDVPANYQEMVRLALHTHQVQIPNSVDSLITKGGFVRGQSGEGTPFQLVKPVGTVVASDRPIFEWKSLEGASKYRVTLLDADMNSVADSGWLTTTTWAPEKPLQRETTYVWQVAGLRNGLEVTSPEPPAGEARFRIIDQRTQDRLEQEQRQYAGSHLLLGLLYARQGLLDEAEQNFQQLVNANPSSREMEQLLENLKKLRAWSR